MTTEGYVIARSRTSSKQYFTSSSSYDRPRWIPAMEATVYHSPELAQKAAVKLGVAGAYGARVVSLKEAMELEMPDDKQQQDPNAPPEGGMDASFGPGEDGKSEMTADEQQDACPDCNHTPCTCEGGDGDQEGADGDEGGDIHQEIEDHFAGGEADIDPQDGEVDDEHRDEPELPATHMEGIDTTVTTIKYQNLGAVTPLDDADSKQPEDKVSVPSEVMSDLKATIAKFDAEAKEKNEVDDTRASFCLTVAAALKTLQSDLAQGDSAGMKQAQIHMTSWMNAITTQLPLSVSKFVLHGGRKATLSDLFSAKKFEKKMVAEAAAEHAAKHQDWMRKCRRVSPDCQFDGHKDVEMVAADWTTVNNAEVGRWDGRKGEGSVNDKVVLKKTKVK